jgi:hypothetical protein
MREDRGHWQWADHGHGHGADHGLGQRAVHGWCIGRGQGMGNAHAVHGNFTGKVCVGGVHGLCMGFRWKLGKCMGSPQGRGLGMGNPEVAAHTCVEGGGCRGGQLFVTLKKRQISSDE